MNEMNEMEKLELSKLDKQLASMDKEQLQAVRKDYETIKEGSVLNIENLKSDKEHFVKVNELVLNETYFRKVEPTWKYEELDAYWDLMLSKQQKTYDFEVRKYDSQIKNAVEELQIIENTIKKIDVLLE